MTTEHDEHFETEMFSIEIPELPTSFDVGPFGFLTGRGGLYSSHTFHALHTDGLPALQFRYSDPLSAVLDTYRTGTAWLVDSTLTALPSVASGTLEDLSDACGMYSLIREQAYNGVAPGRADLLEMLADRFVSVADAPTLPLLREQLEGEQLRETSAADPVAQVFTTTMTHTPRMDGTIRTFRRHLKVVDSSGNARPGHELKRDADTLLLMFSNEHNAQGAPILGSMRLIGSQDMQGNEVVEHQPGTESYGLYGIGMLRPDHGVIGGRADIKGNGQNRKANPWAKHDSAYYRPSDYQVRADVEMGKRKPTARTYSHHTVSMPDARSLIDHPTSSTGMAYGLVELLVTTFRGGRFVGHRWIKAASTRAKRAARAATATRNQPRQTIDHATHAEHIEQAALELSQRPAPDRQPLRFTTDSGTRINVSLVDGKGYRVTVTPPAGTGKRMTFTRSAPVYVAASLRNYDRKRAVAAAPAT